MKPVLPINLADLLDCRTVESERVEFKRFWDVKTTGSQVLRTICAFANDIHNLNGGYVIIGIEERGGRACAAARRLGAGDSGEGGEVDSRKQQASRPSLPAGVVSGMGGGPVDLGGVGAGERSQAPPGGQPKRGAEAVLGSHRGGDRGRRARWSPAGTHAASWSRTLGRSAHLERTARRHARGEGPRVSSRR